MNRIIIILILLTFGCNSSDNRPISIKTIKTEHPKILPKSEFEITNGGIGTLLIIGGSFDSIEYNFDDNFVDTLTMSSEGIAWSAKRINLGNEEWILAEDNTGEGFITRLHTNSSRYKSKNGVFVGQKFSEVLKKDNNIGVGLDKGTLFIRLYNEGISISVDSISEKQFYNSSIKKMNQLNELKDIPESATVDEIGVF
jgi:hypothetical protein